MKILFITGKGGVGKSTISCSLALKFSRENQRTLLVSADQVHSISDILGRKIGNRVTKITSNLNALEIDSSIETNRYFGNFLDFSREVLVREGLNPVEAEEIAVFPGAGDLASLLRIYEYYLTTNYEYIIVDTASSSETIKLLKSPSIMKNFIKKMTDSSPKLMDKFTTVIEKIFSVSLPKHQFYSSLLKVMEELEEAKTVFSNPDITRFKVVCSPERVVFRETERLTSYLALLGFPVDTVFVNRYEPAKKRFIQEAEKKFHPIDIYAVPEAEKEPFSFKRIEKFAETCLRNFTNGFDQVYLSIEMNQEKDFVQLSIPAGGIKKGEVEIYSDNNTLFIKMRETSREIKLPQYLSRMKVEKASLKDGQLLIYFKKGIQEDERRI